MSVFHARPARLRQAVAVAILLCAPTEAQHHRPLSPLIRHSPDGRYSLLVVPTGRNGEGTGKYQVIREGEVLWEREHPFTFVEARLSSVGEVAGCGYTEGIGRVGELVVAALAPDGSVRWTETSPRSYALHRHADPWARGLFLDEGRDLLVARIADPKFWSQHELWWIYRFSTGHPGVKLDLHGGMSDPEFARWSTFAEPVPGTDLVIASWDAYREGHGVRFTLSDLEGTVVWQLDRPLDYVVEDDEMASNRRWKIVPVPASSCGSPGRMLGSPLR